jgi:hypothetical protein
MSTEPAHFTLTEDGAYLPTPFARSRWGDDHLNGPAVVGLAARVLENHCGSEDFMPVRFTADLFRAARNGPTTVDARAVRDGRRVRSAECDVVQDGQTVARVDACAIPDVIGAARPSVDCADVVRSAATP